MVWWVDVDAPDESPLLLALRASLAAPDELRKRDRTVADWIRPLESNEAGARAAFRDAAKAVFDGHWRAEAAPTRVGRAARDYQIAHLSRLMARLDE